MAAVPDLVSPELVLVDPQLAAHTRPLADSSGAFRRVEGQAHRVPGDARVYTSTEVRDPIAGTPHHKDVRVRLEPAGPDEAATAEEASARVRDLIGAGRAS